MQQLALDALRERELELSQLVDLAPCHLWRLRPDGEPSFFNQRMVDYLGLDLFDISQPGKSRLQVVIDSVIHYDDAPAFGMKLRECLATGESFAMRFRLRRMDGTYRWMSSRAEPLRDGRGHIVQWYGQCSDIHDEMSAAPYPRSMVALTASAHAAHRWLASDPPNIERARRSVVRIIRDAEAAADPAPKWAYGRD